MVRTFTVLSQSLSIGISSLAISQGCSSCATAAGEDQVNDADADHSTGGMSWDCASSSVSAPKLTANGLNLLMCTLKCDFVPVEDDKTMFTDLQELGLEFEW